MRRAAAVLLLLFAPSASLLGEAASPAWEDYRLGQFTASRARTPQDVLALDNNGEIVLACREGCSRESLSAAGISATESQLALLSEWSLLGVVDGELRPTFPILDAAATVAMSRLVLGVTEAIADEIEPQVRELVSLLAADGNARRAYAVVFSYVLDGQVWNYIDELDLIPKRSLEKGAGRWGGEIWAYMPHWAHEPRTSLIGRGNISVRATWLPEIRSLLEPLLSGEDGLRRVFATDFDEAGAASPELSQTLEQYGVLGSDRALTLAMIQEAAGEPLYALCNDLTTAVAQAMEKGLDREALAAELGLASEPQAMLIGYHSVMWGLMERLVERGALELPRALAEPAAAERSSAADLLVLVHRPVAAPAEDGDGE